ncbi:MAG: hypothetical protein K2W84_02495 [Burkholderiales bacterium]|nr:hypothetical protein [Burkholderiales bacterium]
MSLLGGWKAFWNQCVAKTVSINYSIKSMSYFISCLMLLPNLLPFAATVAERYLTLLRAHPTKTYDYARRGYFGLPIIEVEQHGRKCKQGESWIYFAVPDGADLRALKAGERLYVGAQTQDRMFRGDGMGGENYHHAEMRAGNGDDTPLALLRSGNRIAIYRAQANRIATIVQEQAELSRLQILLQQPHTPTKHLGWWFEQYVLFSEPRQWRWNTASAHKALSRLFAS